MRRLQSGICSLGFLLIIQSSLFAQTLKVTTEFILFDCTASPALFQDYQDKLSAPAEKSGIDLEIRKAVLGYLRDNAPVQRSIRSVDVVHIGKQLRKTVEIGHQILTIQILAHPASRGAYPMQIQQKCVNRARPEFGSSNHSQNLQMVPNSMHMRHASWNNITARGVTTNAKLILFWLTTLSEQPPVE